MGPENLHPLEELKRLDQQVEQAQQLADLKPIFNRLEEIARQQSGDFDVQLVVGEVKQRLVERGTKLKTQGAPPEPMPAATMPAAVQPPPPLNADPPDAAILPPSSSSNIPTTTAEAPAAPPHMPPAIPAAASAAVPPVPPGVPPKSARAGSPANRPPSNGAPPNKPNWKRALWMGALIGGVLSVIAVAVVFLISGRNASPVGEQVAVQVTTLPTGAAIQINGEDICTSDCTAQLPPGTYQVTALLDGYDPAASEITVVRGQPASLDLALSAQPQSVRILADLSEGTVTLDGQTAGSLQDGQFVLERVEPGSHTIRVNGNNSEAAFTFELAEARMPSVIGTVNTRDLLAVIVTSFANSARAMTSSGPYKLTLNGQAQQDVGPLGVELTNYRPGGAASMVLGEGTQQRTIEETFGSAPMLTVFLKTDQNIGTLVVSTREDDVQVFLDNRAYPRRTRGGQLRLQTIGRVSVRVAKDGFEELPAQTVNVAKGSETRVSFNMRALPEFSSLEIDGGTPGAEVLIDGEVVGTLSPAGGFRNSSVEPGGRTVEIRRSGFEPKRFERTFRRGQPTVINGQDPVLVAVRAPTPPPPPPPVAPKPAPETPKVATAPKPRTGTVANFDNPGAWVEQDGVWRHRGEAALTYSMPANGVFTFTIHKIRGGNRLLFRSGKVRWAIQYKDNRNYAFYEMDNDNFWSKVEQGGKTYERNKVKHNLDSEADSWPIQVDVNPQRVIVRGQRDGEWITLDTWTEPGRNFTDGKFAILVNGNDEVGLSDFRYTGR